MAITGSCHCGKLSYTLDHDPKEAMQCNCSICRRKGYLLAFASLDKFTSEASADDIGVYTFGKHNIQHQFCRHCGCAPFGRGTGPDGTEMIAVNLRCADDLELSKIRIKAVDGASL